MADLDPYEIDSAGDVVNNAQLARDDGALVQNPVAPEGRVGSDLAGGETFTADGEVPVYTEDQLNRELGTDSEDRTLDQTQATPPTDINNSEPIASQTAGIGADRDDNVAANKNTTQQTVNASFSQKILPKPNALDIYASYTYSLSWYLLTPDQYNQAMNQQRKSTNQWSLLMQSGGASAQDTSATVAGRNSFFNVDYYMDNLTIETNFSGKGTGAARGVSEFNFQVTEPNGITLIPNLYNAVTNLYRAAKADIAWRQAQYCLVIRFFGYDETGKLVQAGRSGALGSTNATDPKAGIEKYIPFTITELTTKIVSKQIVYDIKCVPTSYSTGFSSDRGTIPFAYELIGNTVGEVLNGRPAGTVYQATTDGRNQTDTPGAAIAPANSRDGLATSTLSGGSIDTETGAVGYAFGA